MYQFIFTGLLPLVLLYALAFFVNITVHELGHAIPVLLFTNDETEIYIGSLGDPYDSWHATFGRIVLHCKKNPFTWYKGCCMYSDYGLPLNQRILITAGGPIASFILTFASWLLLSAFQDAGFLRVVTGGIFVISLLVTCSILIPFYKVRYTSSGIPVYNDLYKIIRLIQRKY